MSNITQAEKEFDPLLQWGSLKARFSDSSLSSFRFSDESTSLNNDTSTIETKSLQENESKEDLKKNGGIEDSDTTKLKGELKGPVEYMQEVLLPQLKPILISTLKEAMEKQLFDNGKSFLFNATNCLSQILLNIDPLHPELMCSPLLDTTLGRMCQQPIRERRGLGAKYSYAENQMSKEKAALIIQRQVRGWLVRKLPYVQEMRIFWKTLKTEKSSQHELSSSSSLVNLKPKKLKCKIKH